MDTSRFQDTRTGFQILDFHASMAWRNLAAISFLLGRYSDTFAIPGSDWQLDVGENRVFECFGWLDVVHPCLDHIKARIRTNIGNEQLDHEMQIELIETVFNALGIPRDETYEVDFFTASGHTAIHQTIDRNGMTDRT